MTPEDRRKLIREVNTRYRFTDTMVSSLLDTVEQTVADTPEIVNHPSYPLGFIFAWAATFGVVLSDYAK
jgi:hypothetical protein